MSKMIYLKIKDDQSDFPEQEFEGKIKILSWSWGLSSSYSHKTQRSPFSVELNEVLINKWVDESSAYFEKCSTRTEAIHEVRLTVYNDESIFEKPELEYIMSITKISWFFKPDFKGKYKPVENIKFNFKNLEIHYNNERLDVSNSVILSNKKI